MEACSSELLSMGTASLMVSLEGVMMRMNAEKVGETETKAGWREASCVALAA